MALTGSRTLPLTDAKFLVDGTPSAHSRSLFAVLEAESLIAIIEQPPTHLGSEPQYSVRFAFERIGDHLITEHLLAGVTDVTSAFARGGAIHFLVVSDDAARANAGILEALSIQLPEAHGEELIDAIATIDRRLLWDAFIAALQWRNPHFISGRSSELVREALGSNETVGATFEAILGIAARPDHPLNARFLDRLLRRIPMLARDPFWANFLEESYSGWSDTIRAKSGVHRLIQTARTGRLDDLPDAVAALWTIALAWFCASPDRRIRDQATMAMVTIFRARPDTIALLLRKFALSDDEYISERVLVAAYGALLLTESVADLREIARLVYEFYFADGDPPLNASLRDHARLIVEMSVELGVSPEGLDAALYRPPYRSVWPISLPSDNDVIAYVEDRERFPQMNLVQQVGFATGTDFARYIVEPRVTDAFDFEKAGLDKLGIFRWFIKEAADFGYPGPHDQCAVFDRVLLGKFGGGRGKPGWAERLGKKYYWIFLRRLVGRFADHVDRKTWSATFPPASELQGIDLRDIDPSDLRQILPRSEEDAWLAPSPYVFQGRDDPDGDVDWVNQDDLTDIEQTLVLMDVDGSDWHILNMGASWDGKRSDRGLNTYRHVSRSVHAAACNAADTTRVKKAFATARLDHFDDGPHDYRGYLAEYPWRLPYANRLFDPIRFQDEDAGISFQHLGLRQLRGREWERDYSQLGESPTLLMPSVALVNAGDLRWDHRGGWQDADGRIQIRDPWWWSSDESPALVCRMEYLDRFLEQNNQALIILGFQVKFIAGTSPGPGRLTERTLIIRQHRNTRLIKRKLVASGRHLR
jgi:hypothetical protein